MRTLCPKCNRTYDDAEQWTICPHTPLGYPVFDLCPRCDTLESVHGPCIHQQATLTSAPKGVIIGYTNIPPCEPEIRLEVPLDKNVMDTYLGDAWCHSVNHASEIIVMEDYNEVTKLLAQGYKTPPAGAHEEGDQPNSENP